MTKIVGIDFDNTIVSYDNIFYQAALEKKLIPQDLLKSKESVKNFLCQCGQEEKWTLLQGYVYGNRMQDVAAFCGVTRFFQKAQDRGYKLYIVSHKTKYPYLGPKFDLHEAAYGWLKLNQFFEPEGINFPETQVFFELTKEEKIKRIAALHCDFFIDDLPEILNHSLFPDFTKKLLFSPNEKSLEENGLKVFSSWEELAQNFSLS